MSLISFWKLNPEAIEGIDNALPQDPGEHVEALSQYGEVFKTFYQPKSGSRTETFLSRLEAVDTATVYPFLPEAFNQLAEDDPEELNQILVVLESYLIRRMICYLTAKNYNRVFLDLTKFVQKRGRVSKESLVTFLVKAEGESSRFPTDEEFKKAWMEYPLYKWLAQYKVRAVLTALDEALHENKTELLPLPDGLTIEHLMPVKWEENWPLVLSNPDDPVKKIEQTDIRNNLLHTLGNLTLITGSLNPSLSNGAWVFKKPEIMKFSKLNLNRHFHDHDEWNEKTIKKRGESLFKKAKKIWPFPEVD